MDFFSRFPTLVQDVFKAIKLSGGKAYVVGGYVRDELLQLNKNKDVDVEVFGLEPQLLQVILTQFGDTQQIGRTFGVFKLALLPEFDFALARMETKTGYLHQDFSIQYDLDMSFEEACKRRDLTINSILYDPDTDEYIDPYFGLKDLKNKIIRMVDQKTFKEDPLRVLRVARISALLPDFIIEEQTKKVCQEMASQLKYISKERVFSEYSKLLLSTQPSVGFKFLYEINALIPKLTELANTIQRVDFHPEGNVFNHTMLVIDLAALCKQKTAYPLGFMWAALLHDIGKPKVTTPQGKAPNHDLIGEQIAKQFIAHLTGNKHLGQYVSIMVRCHMVLMLASRNEQNSKTYLKVLRRLNNVVK